MGGLLEPENMLALYRSLFITMELLTIIAGLALWTIAGMGSYQAKWRIAEIPPFMAFFYGAYALGWTTILMAINHDLGFSDTPLLRLFTEEAIDGVTDVYAFFWYVTSLISFLLLGISAHSAIFSSATFVRKLVTTLLAVAGIQILTNFYFEFIK